MWQNKFMKKIFIFLSLIAVFSCQSPEEKYNSKLENIKLLQEKILTLKPINGDGLSDLTYKDLDVIKLEEDEFRYNDLQIVRYELIVNMITILLDKNTNAIIKKRILWFLDNERSLDQNGFACLGDDVRNGCANGAKATKIKEKLYLDVIPRLSNRYNTSGTVKIDIGTVMLIYQEYARLYELYYDLSDRNFLANELCRSVDAGVIDYASALIDYSLKHFDPGLLRCVEYDFEETYGSTMIEFKGNTIGMESDRDALNKLGVCPMSLRRISGRNYGRAAESRARAFEKNLKNLKEIDSSKVKSYSDAINKIQSRLYSALSNTPKMSSIPSSMNALTGKYDKWAACGNCSLESNDVCK